MFRPALALLLLTLGACAALEPQREPTGWSTHSAQLAGLQYWTARGKVALHSADSAESAALVWQQRGATTDLRLSGPLGVGTTIVHSDGTRLDIRRGDEHRQLDISTPEAIRAGTGWDLPLRALAHWLKGAPSPDETVQALEVDPDTGLLRRLTQADWEIQYRDYGVFNGFVLPRRLQLKQGETEARVLIADWQTAPDGWP